MMTMMVVVVLKENRSSVEKRSIIV